MKTNFFAALLAVALIAAGCGDGGSMNVTYAPEEGATSKTPPPVDGTTPPPSNAVGITGKVIETMDAGRYTYVRIDSPRGQVWAAGPKIAVKVGDQVRTTQGMPMSDHHSPTLDRKFDVVFFVTAVEVVDGTPIAKPSGANPHGADPHGFSGTQHTSSSPPSGIDFSKIAKPDAGHTVEEIFAARKTLAGKEIRLRGKVVKFSAEIMGKNWLHVRDGTGKAGTNDLTVTSASTAKVGDTVLIVGHVRIDRDFGFGYKYDTLIEDAQVTVE